MLIRVEKQDIDGFSVLFDRRRCATTCPVAAAVRRQLLTGDQIQKGATVSVSYDAVMVGLFGRLTELPLPQCAREALKRYDRGGPMYPFEFHLDTSALPKAA